MYIDFCGLAVFDPIITIRVEEGDQRSNSCRKMRCAPCRSTALALPSRSASGALATVVHMVDPRATLASSVKLSGRQSDAAQQLLEPRIRAQWVIDEIEFQGSEPMRSTLICFLEPLERALLVIESDINLRYPYQRVIVCLGGRFQFVQDSQRIFPIT